MQEYVEFSGKDVDDAIANACKHFGIDREKLEIEIVSGGSSGIFGLVGVKKARILAQKRASIEDIEPENDPLDAAKTNTHETRLPTKPGKAKPQPRPVSRPEPRPEPKPEPKPEPNLILKQTLTRIQSLNQKKKKPQSLTMKKRTTRFCPRTAKLMILN